MSDMDRLDAYYQVLPPECPYYAPASVEGPNDLDSFRTMMETYIYRLMVEMKTTNTQISNVVRDELCKPGFIEDNLQTLGNGNGDAAA